MVECYFRMHRRTYGSFWVQNRSNPTNESAHVIKAWKCIRMHPNSLETSHSRNSSPLPLAMPLCACLESHMWYCSLSNCNYLSNFVWFLTGSEWRWTVQDDCWGPIRFLGYGPDPGWRRRKAVWRDRLVTSVRMERNKSFRGKCLFVSGYISSISLFCDKVMVDRLVLNADAD